MQFCELIEVEAINSFVGRLNRNIHDYYAENIKSTMRKEIKELQRSENLNLCRVHTTSSVIQDQNFVHLCRLCTTFCVSTLQSF